MARSYMALVIAVVVVAVVGRADDRGVSGHKLVLLDAYARGRTKVVVVFKDRAPGAIHAGVGSGAPGDLTGEIRLCPTSDPANAGRFALPAAHWVGNTSQTARYVNAAAAPGTLGMHRVTIKPGKLLKAVARSLGDGDAASGDDGPDDLDLDGCALVAGETMDVEVEVTDAAGGETHRMCTRFTVERVKDAPGRCRVASGAAAPAPCGVCGVAPPTTTVTTTSITTSTTVVPCGLSAPFCNGACPEGSVCLPVSVPDGAGCLCVSTVFTCVGSSPACNGTCPEGTTCQPFVPGVCECQ